MTQQVIYHDFQKKREQTGVALTGPLLAKGRRLMKSVGRINTALNASCVFLCGACSAVSLVVLFLLVRG